MATIRVKCGGCGIKYTDKNGKERHALKTTESGAFECDDAQAERLVGLGVAEYVGLQWREVADEVADEEPATLPETQQDEVEEPVVPETLAEKLEKMSYLALKYMAAERGIVPDGKKKPDYIAALVAAGVEIDDEDDELPELCAADPE